MKSLGQKLPTRALGIRRAFLMLLALAYVFVGLAHTVSCTDDAIGVVMTSDAGTGAEGGSHHGDSKKSPLVAESCHVWMPLMMPPLCAVAVPSNSPGKLALAAPPALLAGHARLDTPPPKILI